jgi:hypothetical protein
MKRFHVHVSVGNLDESIRFYSTLFAAQPTIRQSDYAKWMLEDPRMNFAISTHRQPLGVNHLDFQVDSGGGIARTSGLVPLLWTTLVEYLWTTRRAIPRAALRLVATDAPPGRGGTPKVTQFKVLHSGSGASCNRSPLSWTIP